MSTRSLMGVVLPDKTIKWTYCHFDGYPEAREPLLHIYFNSYEKAYELISKGELRSVGEGIDDCDYFEENTISGIAENLEAFLALDCGSIYKYLFYNDEWYWVKSKYNGDWGDEVMEILPNPYKQITIYDDL